MKDIEDEEDKTDGDDQSKDDRVSPLPKVHSLHEAVDDWETIWQPCQGVYQLKRTLQIIYLLKYIDKY